MKKLIVLMVLMVGIAGFLSEQAEASLFLNREGALRVYRLEEYQLYDFITPQCPEIVEIAERIKQIRKRTGGDVVELIFNFVSLIDYERDIILYRRIEHWAFPRETLAHGKGDCEDTAFLMISLLLAVGINPEHVRVVGGWYEHPDGTFGHAWVEILREKNWYILETTSDKPLEYGMNMWKVEDNERYIPMIHIFQKKFKVISVILTP